MKKQLNFNGVLLGLNQAPMTTDGKTMSIAKNLSVNLASTTTGDSLKYYSWGVSLEKDGTLELDPSDVELLKSTVQAFEIAAIIKAQILLVILK